MQWKILVVLSASQYGKISADRVNGAVIQNIYYNIILDSYLGLQMLQGFT